METIRDRITKIENELAKIKEEIAADAKKPPFPKRGDRFMYRGKEFIALEERAGGIFAVMTRILIEGKAFDNDNCNDWKKSSLRQYMNGELLEDEFDEDDLIAFETDLISVDGNRAYGKSLDCISLLTFDDRRKHRDILPKYDDWTWTATPWWCGEEGSAYPNYANNVYIVSTSGAYGDDNADYTGGAAVPACVFNPSIFQSKEVK